MEELFNTLNHYMPGVAGTAVTGAVVWFVNFARKFRNEHIVNNQVAMEHGPLKQDVEHIKQNAATKEDIAMVVDKIGGVVETVDLIKASHLDQNRNSIIRICNEAIGQGWIDSHQLRSLCDLHDRYKKLGGNGYVDEMVNHTKTIPPRDRKSESESRRRGLLARLFG